MDYLVKDVIAVSCAVHRINGGFVKKQIGSNQKSNSAFLYEHFCESNTVDVIDCDYDEAEKVMDYLQGLGFKALERTLTDFERKVLGLVTVEAIDKASLGIAASLPNVYQMKVKSDTWSDRERELGASSEYLGKQNTRCAFPAKIEFERYIPSTESYLYTASVNNKDILKFFKPNNVPAKIEVGQTYMIAGYVKPHQINKHTGFKETMINRVKFEATGE